MKLPPQPQYIRKVSYSHSEMFKSSSDQMRLDPVEIVAASIGNKRWLLLSGHGASDTYFTTVLRNGLWPGTGGPLGNIWS